MRILSKRTVRELVLYSPQHIARLEKAGLFPKRVQLGPSRVGWIESEVLDWLEARIKRREENQRFSLTERMERHVSCVPLHLRCGLNSKLNRLPIRFANLYG